MAIKINWPNRCNESIILRLWPNRREKKLSSKCSILVTNAIGKKKAYDENFYCIKVWSWKHAVNVVKNIFMYTFQLFLLFILASIGCWPNADFTPMYLTVRYGWYGLQPLSVAIETEKRSKVSIPNAPSFALTLYGFLSGNVNREYLLHWTALFFFSIHQSLATYKISIWSHWTHMDR